MTEDTPKVLWELLDSLTGKLDKIADETSDYETADKLYHLVERIDEVLFFTKRVRK